jgi:hypothetical protein
MVGGSNAVVVRRIVELPDHFDQFLVEAAVEGIISIFRKADAKGVRVLRVGLHALEDACRGRA